MKPFAGFPDRMDFTPIPNPFLNKLLPQITDMAELKTTLYIFMSIYSKRGYPRFITLDELKNSTSLIKSLGQADKAAEEALSSALNLAANRGVILHLKAERDGKMEDVYFLNTRSDRQAIEKIQRGELKLPALKVSTKTFTPPEELPSIFTLYEENIGMLTPMIAEELKDAEKLYPPSWIRDAIKMAVNQNKRKWGYISAILERWTAEGKSDGAYRRDAEKEDPDKYIKGKYGHMVRRR